MMGEGEIWMFSRQDNCIRPGDLVLFGALVLAAVLLGLFVWVQRTPGGQVSVRVEGNLVASFSLDQDQTYLIQTAGGGENLLVIQDGAVWLEEANCPDRLCVRQGKIRYAGDSLICLPHQLVVELSETGDELDLDAVAG